jgi:hypothetical protein
MPKRTIGLSPDVLNAALHGLEAQKQTIEQHIETVRSLLGIRADGSKRRGRPPKSAATAATESAAPTARKRRRFSAATRARMAEAQRKKYAAAREVSEAPPSKAVAKKRKLSAAGRKRIIEATKKRWREYKAKKAAS